MQGLSAPGETGKDKAGEPLAGARQDIRAGRSWTGRMAWTGTLVGAYVGFALVLFYGREASLPVLSHVVAFSAPAGLLLLLLKMSEGRWLVPFLAAHLFLSIALLAADPGAIDLVVLLALALDALLIARLTGNRTASNLHAFRKGVWVSVTFSGVLVTSVVVASSATVATRAEQIAAGRPYCIVIAKKGSYSLASNLTDLSVFQMRSRHPYRGIYNEYHGVLMVESDGYVPFEHFNWSYNRMNFDFRPSNYDINLPGNSKCLPSPHFVRDLPLL